MKCLIVDDSELWRDALKEELTLLGFLCSVAKSDKEAINALKEAEAANDPFVLITLDRQLEGLRDQAGIRVLSYLKTYKPIIKKQTACIVISGTSSDIDVRDYLKEYFVQDYISKQQANLWESLKVSVNKLLKKDSVGSEPETGEALAKKTSNISQLRTLLDVSFSVEEIQTLCFDLGLDYENIKGERKEDKIRDLILLLQRHNRLPELVDRASRLRPRFSWPPV